jgi:hypothetical protein
MKNYCSVEMDSEIQMVEPIEFEPVTLARLDCIPTPAHGNEELFVLFNKNLPYCEVLLLKSR